jgi:hypothetical protein
MCAMPLMPPLLKSSKTYNNSNSKNLVHGRGANTSKICGMQNLHPVLTIKYRGGVHETQQFPNANRN